MDWLTAVVALAGVVVGAYLTARLQQTATYEQWRRDHLHDLYLELIPTLHRARGAMRSEFAIESNKVGAQLAPLILRAELVCSDEVLAGLRSVSTLLTKTGVPWYVDGAEARAAVPREDGLGTRSAMDGMVDGLKALLVEDLKQSRGRPSRRLVKRLERADRSAEDR